MSNIQNDDSDQIADMSISCLGWCDNEAGWVDPPPHDDDYHSAELQILGWMIFGIKPDDKRYT